MEKGNLQYLPDGLKPNHISEAPYMQIYTNLGALIGYKHFYKHTILFLTHVSGVNAPVNDFRINAS